MQFEIVDKYCGCSLHFSILLTKALLLKINGLSNIFDKGEIMTLCNLLFLGCRAWDSNDQDRRSTHGSASGWSRDTGIVNFIM